ncbi:CocE/NonD family hydrolase [Spirillospora sp. NPDC052242]
MQRTPYNRHNTHAVLLDVITAVQRGYIVVQEDTRGCFGSDGEWLLAQPPHLVAIAPQITWSIPDDGLFFRGGAIGLGPNAVVYLVDRAAHRPGWKLPAERTGLPRGCGRPVVQRRAPATMTAPPIAPGPREIVRAGRGRGGFIEHPRGRHVHDYHCAPPGSPPGERPSVGGCGS